MRLMQILKSSVVGLAALGIMLPQVAAARPANPSEAVKDVALQENGTLRGQVMGAQGETRLGTRVAIIKNGRRVAEAATDGQGRFAVPGLSSGIYVVATGAGGQIVRAWTAAAAPPAATPGLLLVSPSVVLNGQKGGNPWQEHGGGEEAAHCGNGQFLFGAAILGAAITTIIVVATNDAS